MIAGALEVQLFADIARIKDDMAKATGFVTSGAAAMEKAAAGVKVALGSMGIGLGIAAFADLVKGAIEGAAAMHSMSLRTGVTVAALSSLRSAAKLSGTDMNDVATGLQKLSKNMVEAQGGTGAAAKAFASLGVSVTDGNGKLKTADQVMRETAKAMGGFEQGAGLTAAAIAIFGKAGANLLPMLTEMAARGATAGKVTEEQARQAHEFERKMAQLKATTEGYIRTIALDLLPIIIKLPGLFKLAAEAGVAFFAVFVAWPAISAAAVLAFNAFAVAVYEGTTAMEVFKLSMTSSIASIGPTIAQVGLLKSAFALLAAAFVGWEIGTWLRENFVEAQLAGVAFVDGTLKGWETIKYGAQVAWAYIKDTAKSAFAGIAEFFAGVMDRIATGLGALGATGAGSALGAMAKALRDTTANATPLAATLADLKSEYDRNTKAIGDITDAMADEAIKHFAAAKAEEAHKKTLKSTGDAAGDLTKQFDALISKIEEFTAARKLELTQDAALSDGQKMALGIMESLRNGTLKLTEAQRMAIAVALEQALAAEQLSDQHKREVKATLEAAEAQVKYAAELGKEIEKAEEAVRARRQQNDEIGLSKEAIADLTAARYEETAAIIDRQAFRKYEKDLDEAEYQDAVRLAQAKRDLAKEIRDGAVKQAEFDTAKAAREEWERTNKQIADSFVDNLMRGGKSIAQYLKDLFRTLVLRPLLQPIGNMMASGVNAMMGGGAGAAGSANSMSSLFGMGSAASSGAGIWGTMSTAYSAASAAAQGTAVAGAMANGATLEAAVTAASTEGVAAGLGAGIEAGLASVPVVGWIALAGMILYSMFGESKGGPKGNAFAMTSGMTGVGALPGDVSKDLTSAAQQGINAITGGYMSAAAALGIQAGQLEVAIQANTDPEGDSLSHLAAVAKLNGTQVYDRNNLTNPAVAANNAMWEDVGRTPEEMQAAIQEASARAILSALKATDMPQQLADYFAKLDPLSMSADQIANAITAATNANKVWTAFKDLGPALSHFTGLTVEATSSFIEASGGMQQLTASLGSYYENFYSEEEKRQLTAQKIAQSLNSAGIGFDAQTILAQANSSDPRAWFRSVVEEFAAMGAEGEPFVAAMLKVNGAFASIAPAAQVATQAVEDTSAALAAMQAAEKSYYDNFTTEAQKRIDTAKDIQAKLSAAGQGYTLEQILGATREDFAVGVEAFRAMGEAGRPAYEALLSVADEFASISEWGDSAAGGVAQVTSQLASLQAQTQGLQVELLRAQGDTGGANALQRTIDTAGMTAAEIAVFDYNAALRVQIDVLQSASAIMSRLQADTANLQVQLLQAQGDVSGAAALQRQIDTAGMNAAAIAVYDYNQSIRAQISAINAAAAAAAQAAQAEQQLAQQRASMETQLLQAQGNTQAIRELQLAALDPSLRALQQEIWDTQDAAAHAAAAQAKANQRRQELLSSYQQEASRLEGVVSKFKDFARSLREFRDSLLLGNLSPLTPEQKYAQALAEFNKTSAAARGGDADAMGRLQGVSQDFLNASRDFYASSAQYSTDFALVQAALTAAADRASAQASVAQLQLNAIERLMGPLDGIHANTARMAGMRLPPGSGSGGGNDPAPITTRPWEDYLPRMHASSGGGIDAQVGATIVERLESLERTVAAGAALTAGATVRSGEAVQGSVVKSAIARQYATKLKRGAAVV